MSEYELTFPKTGRRFVVKEVGDLKTEEAIEAARSFHTQGAVVNEAGVDRFEGLVLLINDTAWRFQTPKCSYGGLGVQTTAEILELFGFGTKAEILKIISNKQQSRYFFP